MPPYKILCKVCQKVIKGKPIIWDEYYYCSDECLKKDLED